VPLTVLVLLPLQELVPLAVLQLLLLQGLVQLTALALLLLQGLVPLTVLGMLLLQELRAPGKEWALGSLLVLRLKQEPVRHPLPDHPSQNHRHRPMHCGRCLWEAYLSN